MIKKIIYFMLLAVITTSAVYAQSVKEKQVATAVESLRKAMVDADSISLDRLTTNDLSYGHSGGQIQDKATFLHSITSGQSDFVTIDLTNQTIQIHGNTAIVRHILTANTNDNNKPGTVKLGVLTVWVKDHHHWILLARQAVRPLQ